MLLYDRLLDSLRIVDTHADELGGEREVLEHGSIQLGLSDKPRSERTPGGALESVAE